MYRIDERMNQTADLSQPVDLASANGLGVLLRERRRRIVQGATTELDVLATIRDRAGAGRSGNVGRRDETAEMGAR
jgi:hypothetical protein